MLSIKRVCVILKIALWCIALCYFYTVMSWHVLVRQGHPFVVEIQLFSRFWLSILLNT